MMQSNSFNYKTLWNACIHLYPLTRVIRDVVPRNSQAERDSKKYKI